MPELPSRAALLDGSVTNAAQKVNLGDLRDVVADLQTSLAMQGFPTTYAGTIAAFPDGARHYSGAITESVAVSRGYPALGGAAGDARHWIVESIAVSGFEVLIARTLVAGGYRAAGASWVAVRAGTTLGPWEAMDGIYDQGVNVPITGIANIVGNISFARYVDGWTDISAVVFRSGTMTSASNIGGIYNVPNFDIPIPFALIGTPAVSAATSMFGGWLVSADFFNNGNSRGWRVILHRLQTFSNLSMSSNISLTMRGRWR